MVSCGKMEVLVFPVNAALMRLTKGYLTILIYFAARQVKRFGSSDHAAAEAAFANSSRRPPTTTPPPPPPSSSCFPSTATVNLENGKTVTMSELQVGNKVQTGMESAMSLQMKVGYIVKLFVGSIKSISTFGLPRFKEILIYNHCQSESLQFLYSESEHLCLS